MMKSNLFCFMARALSMYLRNLCLIKGHKDFLLLSRSFSFKFSDYFLMKVYVHTIWYFCWSRLRIYIWFYNLHFFPCLLNHSISMSVQVFLLSCCVVFHQRIYLNLFSFTPVAGQFLIFSYYK